MPSVQPALMHERGAPPQEALQRSLLVLGSVQLPSLALLAALGAAQGLASVVVFALTALYPFVLAPLVSVLGPRRTHALWVVLAPALTTAMCGVTGGLSSPILPAFVLVPSMALVRSRVQLVRMILVAASCIALLAILGSLGALPAYEHGNGEVLSLIAIVYATAVATLQLAAVQDVRARSRARLVAARDEARRAAQAREDFLAMMSHELRTPMSGILGSLQLLQSTDLSSSQRDLTRHLEGAGTALHRMLDDIIDYAVHQREARVIELNAVDVGTLLEDCLHLYGSLAKAKGLDLRLDVPDDFPERVSIDGQRLRQVLVQLVANAVKYTPKGAVTLRARWELDTLSLVVEDEGPGIPPEDLHRVFEPFVQLSSGTKRTYGGAGLGLATARQLTEAMGGTVSVTNKTPTGCRFAVDVPCSEVAPPTMDHPSLSGLGRSRGRHRVLVVDDTEVVRELTRMALENVGYSVDTADGGRSGVHAAATGEYSLIVMDLHMPLVDGFDAIAAIRALPSPIRDVPIVAVTADDLPEQHARALDAGADRILTKPVDFAFLGSTVDQFVERR